jgi:hypothetical protein
MAKKISRALLDRVAEQRKSLGTGVLIYTKNMPPKMTVRLLPYGDAVPGENEAITSVFSAACGNKGYTSPKTFGKMDPVIDWLDTQWGSADKARKDQLQKIAGIRKEYYLRCITREDVGNAAAPQLHILPCKKNPYGQILDYISATEMDISDPIDGRDFIYAKEGSGMSTEYKITAFMDKSALGQKSPDAPVDKALQAALLKRAETFSVWTYVPAPDWEIIEEIYQSLTGESIPDQYLTEENQSVEGAAPAEEPADTGTTEADDGTSTVDDAGAVGGEVEPQVDSKRRFVIGTSRVSFQNGDDAMEGLVTGEGSDPDDGSHFYEVTVDGDPEPWPVADVLLTLVEPPKTGRAPLKAPAGRAPLKAPAGKGASPAAKAPAPKASSRSSASSALRARVGKK